MAATASLITLGAWAFSELPRSKNMFPPVSEVVSLLTTTQLLQMRGGADTDEKMGHERDASLNPRAMCYNFQLSAHCQVCRHQLLRTYGSVAGMVEGGRGEQEFQELKINHSWYTECISIYALTGLNPHS